MRCRRSQSTSCSAVRGEFRLCQQHRVLLADINGSHLQERVSVMRDEGCDVSGLRCDITDAASVMKLAQSVSAGGGLAVLAHVAGLSPSLGDFESIMRVNLRGAALVAEAMLPLTRMSSAAIFVSSLAAHNFTPPEDIIGILRNPTAEDLVPRLEKALGPERATPPMAYALSKWGLMLMVRTGAIGWGTRGARIVSLSPGIIATTQGAIEFQKSEGKRRLFELTPLKREGTMLEIADAMEFLASARASFINGTDLLVDGGLSAAVAQR
jgi:NAD(P)-dependent dehydrogenase (short-subunit alcohol dehydrogenase family)